MSARSNGFDKRPQDINRTGRPPKEYCLTDILKEQGNLEDVESGDKKISRKQAIAQKLWAMAMSGDVQAMKYLYDRVDGRPKESIDLDHSGNIDITDITAEEREQRIAELLKETGIIRKVKDDSNTN